ncbi:MAG TPA: hydroxymethylglutaryl-CoA reductase, degradative [Saprospiraceae bacterium]|nr:hydroxymethylglutaryl-CoA reductase, degradative [Saprospiraceae bacterium]HMU02101.1 hydroxymethylglutaryl-CoA reductase, degradative [Saprospiraceae bacterium]
MHSKSISGFSKFSKSEKIEWLKANFLNEHGESDVLAIFQQNDVDLQKVIDGFSENTISNFVLPYGLAPNFLIDGNLYCVPMVIEESSVVAAASAGAKYWQERGGFKTTILGTTKIGQVHFVWNGESSKLISIFPEIEKTLRLKAAPICENMAKRGGGITKVELLDFTDKEKGLYQLRVHFETCDSMGANFINSVLENFATTLEDYFVDNPLFTDAEKDINIIMSILSNYTPECVVRAEVSCPVKDLGTFANGMMAEHLAEKFRMAVRIAHIDPYRATTHNKGIYNGIDAVVLATGNDFRAIEAAGHTYAARDGQYKSLSNCEVENGIFRFWLDVPLALGTVGGLTSLHPLAKLTLDILGNPSAEQLMRIIASVGLAQNFGAVRSLVTTGIQQGHMKMHMMNILNHLKATDLESAGAIKYFEDKTVSFAGVRDYISELRK